MWLVEKESLQLHVVIERFCIKLFLFLGEKLNCKTMESCIYEVYLLSTYIKALSFLLGGVEHYKAFLT